jgi:hypothetical protein
MNERSFCERYRRAAVSALGIEEQVIQENHSRSTQDGLGGERRGGARSGKPGSQDHLSTNYVFDGRRPQPYGEDDLPAPRSVYALTKLAGEYAARGYGVEPLVVRSAGLYGMYGSASKGGNFVQRMVARARDQGNLRMVADQRLQPTFTQDRLVPSSRRSTRASPACCISQRTGTTTSRWRSWKPLALTYRLSRPRQRSPQTVWTGR